MVHFGPCSARLPTATPPPLSLTLSFTLSSPASINLQAVSGELARGLGG